MKQNQKFQSRNGLIWTKTPSTEHYFLQLFQSRNGLIWTQAAHARKGQNNWISIPQRSDLNSLVDVARRWGQFISIPQRSDLNDAVTSLILRFATISIPQRSDLNTNAILKYLDFRKISIPQRSDLNSFLILLIFNSFLFQSRNGLIWTKWTRYWL